jgi:hypothetical protein
MTRFNTEARTATGRNLFKDKKKKKAPEGSSGTSPAVQLGEHGRYQIKSGRLSGEYVARAFPKPPTNARGLIAEARGATEEAAIAALHAVIDAREIRRTDDRRADPTTGFSVPSTEEFIEAVGQVALSRPQRAMLTALALADDEGLPEGRVASAAGYKSNASANRALASAGLLIANYLSLDATSRLEPATTTGRDFWVTEGAKETKKTLGTGSFTPSCVKPLGLSVSVEFACPLLEAHHNSENPGTQREITRSKHEHVLHTALRNPLKRNRNRHHPSSARRKGARPWWLRSVAFGDLLGTASVRNRR